MMCAKYDLGLGFSCFIKVFSIFLNLVCVPQVISSNVILADKSCVYFHGSSKTTGATELLTSLTFQSAETAQKVFHTVP